MYNALKSISKFFFLHTKKNILIWKFKNSFRVWPNNEQENFSSNEIDSSNWKSIDTFIFYI